MAEKVAKLGVSREKDFMYYVKDGAVWKVQRKQPGVQKGHPEKVADGGFQMDYDFIYFVDKDGDVSRAQRAVGGQRRKVTQPAATRPKGKGRKPAARGRVTVKSKGGATRKASSKPALKKATKAVSRGTKSKGRSKPRR